MTRKVYKSAMGKAVDIGALMLQNEQTRAVGNMNVNARGDLLDSQNRVIETRNRTSQRNYKRQSTPSSHMPVTRSTVEARGRQQPTNPVVEDTFDDLPMEDVELEPVAAPKIVEPAVTSTNTQPRGGLAAAIARSREVKQELDKPPRSQDTGLKKI